MLILIIGREGIVDWWKKDLLGIDVIIILLVLFCLKMELNSIEIDKFVVGKMVKEDGILLVGKLVNMEELFFLL